MSTKPIIGPAQFTHTKSARTLSLSTDPQDNIEGLKIEKEQALKDFNEEAEKAAASIKETKKVRSELKTLNADYKVLEFKLGNAVTTIQDLQDEIANAATKLKTCKSNLLLCKGDLAKTKLEESKRLEITKQQSDLADQLAEQKDSLKDQQGQINFTRKELKDRTAAIQVQEVKIREVFEALRVEANKLGIKEIFQIPLTHFFPKELGGEDIGIEQLIAAARDQQVIDDLAKSEEGSESDNSENSQSEMNREESGSEGRGPGTGIFGERKGYMDPLKHIPTFRGTKGEDPVRHVDDFGDYIDIQGIEGVDYVSIFARFGFSLGGKARLWFKENKATFNIVNGDDGKSWMLFVRAFSLKFSVAGSTEHELIQAWSALRWNEASEDLDDFAYRIEDLAKVFGKSKSDILIAFRMGLQPCYSVQIIDKGNLSEAKEYLKRIIAELRRGTTSNVNTGGAIPFMVAGFENRPKSISFEDGQSGPMYKIERRLDEMHLNIADLMKNRSRERSNSRDRNNSSSKENYNFGESAGQKVSRDYSRENYDSRNNQKGNSNDRGRENSRDRGRDYSKDRGRDYSKDRGRDYSKDRGRDYSRDRGRDYSRDRGRDYSRDRDSRNKNSNRSNDGNNYDRNKSGERRSSSGGRNYSRPLSEIICHYCEKKGHVVRFCDKMKRDKEMSDQNSSKEGAELSKRLDKFRVHQEVHDDLEGYIRNLSSN